MGHDEMIRDEMISPRRSLSDAEHKERAVRWRQWQTGVLAGEDASELRITVVESAVDRVS